MVRRNWSKDSQTFMVAFLQDRLVDTCALIPQVVQLYSCCSSVHFPISVCESGFESMKKTRSKLCSSVANAFRHLAHAKLLSLISSLNCGKNTKRTFFSEGEYFLPVVGEYYNGISLITVDPHLYHELPPPEYTSVTPYPLEYPLEDIKELPVQVFISCPSIRQIQVSLSNPRTLFSTAHTTNV